MRIEVLMKQKDQAYESERKAYSKCCVDRNGFFHELIFYGIIAWPDVTAVSYSGFAADWTVHHRSHRTETAAPFVSGV